MARRRETHEDLEKTKRISPYQQIEDPAAYDQGNAYEYEYEEPYEDDYAQVYDDQYGYEYEQEEENEEEEATGGFFSSLVGRIAVGVIVLLLIRPKGFFGHEA